MVTKAEKEKFSYVPTDDLYPEEDGEPMAASDLHRDQLIWTIEALKTHFSDDPSVYVSGDILMYYVEGAPEFSISPDVLVSFGIGMKLRRNYLVWKEGKAPDFVMEFSSKNTWTKDLTDKKDIYASLNIQDYILYDAEGLYLPSQLMGYELVDGNYKEITPDAEGGIHSSSLNLDFHIREEELGIFDPETGEWVKTRAEEEAARADEEAAARREETTRAETAEARAETAEARAQQEANARQQAEAEIAQLREQLTRLQARSS